MNIIKDMFGNELEKGDIVYYWKKTVMRKATVIKVNPQTVRLNCSGANYYGSELLQAKSFDVHRDEVLEGDTLVFKSAGSRYFGIVKNITEQMYFVRDVKSVHNTERKYDNKRVFKENCVKMKDGKQSVIKVLHENA
jgi:hypothetical protein